MSFKPFSKPLSRAVALSLLTGAAFATSAPAAEVARYRFDEGSGNRALDTAGSPFGNDHNGTITDGIYQPAPSPGSSGFSLSFNPTKPDGSPSFSNVNMRIDPATGQSNADLARNITGLTLAAWVRPNEFRPEGPNAFDNVIFIGSGAADQTPPRARASLSIGGGTLSQGFIRAGGRASDSQEDFFSRVSTESILADANNLGPWTHIAAVFNFGSTSNPITIYINGRQVGLQDIPDGAPTGFTGAATSNTASSAMLIGMRPDGAERYDGNIDDVRIFNTALTREEVQALIPEPGSLGVLGLVGATLFGRRRRR